MAKHYGFALTRSGLKPGYRVPRRLLMVDRFTLLGEVATVVGAIVVFFRSFGWIDALGLRAICNNPIGLVIYLGVVFWVSVRSLHFLTICFLRFVFLHLGMTTAQESLYYPLDSKGDWPDAWQKPEAVSKDCIKTCSDDVER